MSNNKTIKPTIETKIDKIVIDLLKHELAPYAKEDKNYQKTIYDLLHTIDLESIANVPDSEMKKRIYNVLIFEMMRDIFSDFTDAEIDSIYKAFRRGEFFR